MSVTSQSRGHKIYYDGKAWRYSDNGNLLQNEARACIRCGKHPTKEGFDACVGYIEGVDSVCCGHGVSDMFVDLPAQDNLKPCCESSQSEAALKIC